MEGRCLDVSVHSSQLSSDWIKKKWKSQSVLVLVVGGIILHLLISSLSKARGTAATVHNHLPIYFTQSLHWTLQLWVIKEKQFSFDFFFYETVYSEKRSRGTLSSVQMLFMKGSLTEIATETKNGIYPGSSGLSVQKDHPPSACFSGGPHWQIWEKKFHGNKVKFI